MKQRWLILLLVLVASFGILGLGGREIALNAPPIPRQVLAGDGAELVGPGQILAGQVSYLGHGGQLLHAGLIDLLLGQEAGAHAPFMEKAEQRAALGVAHPYGIGQHQHRVLGRHAQAEQAVLGVPGRLTGRGVAGQGRGVLGDEPGRDRVGP